MLSKSNVKNVTFFPGQSDSNGNNSNGRVLPKGAFFGSEAFLSDEERLKLVGLFDNGAAAAAAAAAAKSLPSWELV